MTAWYQCFGKMTLTLRMGIFYFKGFVCKMIVLRAFYRTKNTTYKVSYRRMTERTL